MDLEDRAYIVYVATQRWLAIRLDAIGAFLILAVALLVAVGSSGISPSQVGLLLTYCVSLVQMMGMLTRQSAEVEVSFYLYFVFTSGFLLLMILSIILSPSLTLFASISK